MAHVYTCHDLGWSAFSYLFPCSTRISKLLKCHLPCDACHKTSQGKLDSLSSMLLWHYIYTTYILLYMQCTVSIFVIILYLSLILVCELLEEINYVWVMFESTVPTPLSNPNRYMSYMSYMSYKCHICHIKMNILRYCDNLGRYGCAFISSTEIWSFVFEELRVALQISLNVL